MKKLVFYSDCFIFGGCEKLLLSLITSQKINALFDVRYAYARNSDYQKGVDLAVPSSVNRQPLPILGNHNLFYRIDCCRLNSILAFCIKIPFAVLEFSGIYAFYNFLVLLRYLKSEKPDILHINNGGYPAARSCLVAVASAWAAGVPNIVFTVNNLAEIQSDWIDKAVDRFINRQVDKFATASSLAGRLLSERRGISPDKVRQIYNGIPIASHKRCRRELLNELGIAAATYVIVSVALLTERKGQLYLLRAFEEFCSSIPEDVDDPVLILVGDGEDRSLLEKYCRENGMHDSVSFVGQRDDFFDFIHAADLFVLPSLRNEDMPLVILSAMSCEKAIISTRVAGIVEQIRDGVDGVLVDPAEATQLAAAMSRFYFDQTFAASCAASARTRFNSLFSEETLIASYLNLYQELEGE